jgi:hypothetical protein
MKRAAVLLILPAVLVATRAPAADEGTSNRATIGYVTLGAGAAVVATGAYFGIHAYSLKRDADCSGKVCSPAGHSTIEDAQTSATLSTVFFGVGLAAIGVGTYLVLSKPSADNKTAILVTPAVATTFGGFALSATF